MTSIASGSATLSFPSDREIVIMRAFAAPRRLVFEACTQPEHVRRWYGLRSLTMTACEIDLRPGGAWRYVLQAQDGSEYAFSGVYREIMSYERLVYTEGYEAIPGADYLVTTTFDERDGKTILTSHLLYKSKEHRDGHIASGMESGMNETLDRLAERVAEMGNEITVNVTRTFDASAEQVFDAWLDPAAAGRWLFATPEGAMQRVEIDARVGGGFTVVEKRGDVLAKHYGCYIEMDRPHRLVFTFATDPAEEPSRVVVQIRPRDTGCELTLTHTMDAKWAEYADRTQEGWAGILAGLGATLTAEREIVMTRIINAPRELVFDAWTNPEHVDKWWGPNGCRNETFEMDVRPGGMWRFVMHAPNGVDYGNRIVYREVVRPERLVFDHGEDIDDDPNAFHATVSFDDVGGKTRLTMRSLFKTVEQREQTVAFGAVELGNQTLDKLDAFVSTIGAGATHQQGD